MRQNHCSEKDLVKAYTAIIRPIAEYCSVVFHSSMLSDKQDEQIERLQATALWYIFSYGIPYARMREMSGLATLSSGESKLPTSSLLPVWVRNALTSGSRSMTRGEDLDIPYSTRKNLLAATVWKTVRFLPRYKGVWTDYGQHYRHYRDAWKWTE